MFNLKSTWKILLPGLLAVSVTKTSADTIIPQQQRVTEEIQISDKEIVTGKDLIKFKSLCLKKSTCGTLLNYRIDTPISKLSYISHNLSGITYVPEMDIFFLIVNHPASIRVVDTNYQLIQTIQLQGFGDAEDIVYLGENNEFAIVNEDSKLYIGKISPEDKMISAANFQEITFDTYQGNNGAEGVTFDILNQMFYIVKEAKPRKLYSFKRPLSNENMVIEPVFPFDLQRVPHPQLTRDVSAITYDFSTGRLLILSDKDRRLIDIDLQGKVFGILQLPGDDKYEGVTLDNRHRIHLVAEPNEFSIYSMLN